MAFDDVVSALDRPEWKGEEVWAFCPVHKDGEKHGKRSMRVVETATGSTSLKCWAGCDKKQIIAALGLKWSDFAAPDKPYRTQPKVPEGSKPKLVEQPDGDVHTEWRISDTEGKVQAVHHRLDKSDGDKRTWWTMPDGSPSRKRVKPAKLLYGLEWLNDEPGSAVILTEGEKAADALLNAGYTAVGTVTGAQSMPEEEVLAHLDGREVVLWPDNDEEGRAHMRRIAEALFGKAAEVKVYEWPDAPPKGDAADHPALVDGELEHALRKAPVYSPLADKPTGPVSFTAFAPTLMELIEMRRTSGDGVTGIRTGIQKLDQGLGGLNKRTVSVFGASTGNGKSLFAGQVGLQAALDGYRVLLYSSEQSPVLFLDRYVHYLANVNFFDGLKGNYTDDDTDKLRKAAFGFSGIPLMVNPNPGSKVSEIRKMVEEYRPHLLVIDHLQRMKSETPRGNRVQELDDISQEIGHIKNEYELAVFLSVQVNRAPSGRGGKDKRPRITDIRDYSAENDGDNVVILYRPWKDDKDEDELEIQFHCEKGRLGGEWFTRARFLPGQNWIVDEADEPLEDFDEIPF